MDDVELALELLAASDANQHHADERRLQPENAMHTLTGTTVASIPLCVGRSLNAESQDGKGNK